MADIAQLLGQMPGAGGGGGAPPGSPLGGNVMAGPGFGAAPRNLPTAPPQPNAGNAAAAMSDLRNAITLLEKALPAIPMGTPLHSEVLKTTERLIKHMPDGGGSPGTDLNSLLQMARQASQSAPLQALSRMQAGPNAPPAMQPPAAGGGGAAPPMAA